MSVQNVSDAINLVQSKLLKLLEANRSTVVLTFGDGWPSKGAALSARLLFASNFLFVEIRFFGVGVRNCEVQYAK